MRGQESLHRRYGTGCRRRLCLIGRENPLVTRPSILAEEIRFRVNYLGVIYG
jgi:hypothetical protein